MRAVGAALLLTALTCVGDRARAGGDRSVVVHVLHVRNAAVALRQRARHRRH